MRTFLKPFRGFRISAQPAANDQRTFRTFAEFVDNHTAARWSDTIREEIGRFCSAHYDSVQAVWGSPWKQLTLFQAWKQWSQESRQLEILGLREFRAFTRQLPHSPEAAIVSMLQRLAVPEDLWEPFLLTQVFSVPGWFSWLKQRSNAAAVAGEIDDDLTGLLAIRLACDVAVSESFGYRTDWDCTRAMWRRYDSATHTHSESDVVVRSVLQMATERVYRDEVLSGLSQRTRELNRPNSGDMPANSDAAEPGQLLAQMVFCIDVRSERIRRWIESQTDDVETFGFAGFFGVPMAWQEECGEDSVPQVPALISPEFVVRQTVIAEKPQGAFWPRTTARIRRSLSSAWNRMQKSAVSCFSFVETGGLLYGGRLLSSSLRNHGVSDLRSETSPIRPDISGIRISAARQVDIAEGILRGIGLTPRQSRLVVLCGHRSTSCNNPLQATLDCGACGGHSGEPNARFAAALLNQKHVREALRDRGIDIPDSTTFVAAIHDTTSDQIQLLSVETVDPELRRSLDKLQIHLDAAGRHCLAERAPQLQADQPEDLLRRMQDWSEVRPEWGLANNASFIVGPRRLTKRLNLGGRAFLHSYDSDLDKNGAVLNQIMTAPMVVAHWINMQYYASSVEPKTFGSGSKTIHNVVGDFGLYSGNGGDLQTGLPMQSVHNGLQLQHQPLRLLSVICAPRDRVMEVLNRNPQVEHLIVNEWMTLVVLDGGTFWRLRGKDEWSPCHLTTNPEPLGRPAEAVADNLDRE